MKYRKKPVELEAAQWEGTSESFMRVCKELGVDEEVLFETDGNHTGLLIETLEGKMRADKGDWIIKGIKGEFYPCKPDIFAELYEAVTP